MTGFGRGISSGQGLKIQVELKSVNHKQFDCRIDLPPAWQSEEIAIRARLHAKIARGFISCRVHLDMSPAVRCRAARVNQDLAAAYLDALRRAAKRLKLKDDLSASALLRLPQVLHSAALEEQLMAAARSRLVTALNTALHSLMSMRAREGRILQRDLLARLRRLQGLLNRIARRAPSVAQARRLAMRQRLERVGLKVEDARLLREVALYAERADIAEEITRLGSHLQQGLATLMAGGPLGRALDFLVQELLREINTIGSKANDGQISAAALAFKAELERVREQTQNIE